MKVLKYRLATEINFSTEDEPQIEQVFSNVEMGWNEANEEIAKAEAYNGEYTIEDDGVADDDTPTMEDRMDAVEAQAFFTAMMTDTIMEDE